MRLILSVLLLCLFSISAKANQPAFDRHAIEGGRYEKTTKHTKHIKQKHYRQHRDNIPHNYAGHEPQIVAHPAGCPSRAFCGCGASIEVFGKSIRELWLAANWFKFPRTEPAPGMVAVRRHHVFVIREVRAPGLVLAYDANSGGHRTRIHLRSLAGYTVVNPRGSRYAAL